MSAKLERQFTPLGTWLENLKLSEILFLRHIKAVAIGAIARLKNCDRLLPLPLAIN